MPKVKATKTSKINSVLQNFPKKFTKKPKNELYCNLCSCTVSCNKRFLLNSGSQTGVRGPLGVFQGVSIFQGVRATSF